MGCSTPPILLQAGLLSLKHAVNVIDKDVGVLFVGNPYRKSFCGFKDFQHQLPLDSTTLIKWLRRTAPKGALSARAA